MWDLIPGMWKLWGALGGVGAVGLLVLGLFFPAVGTLLKTVVEAVSPIIVWAGTAARDVLKWVWETILWPGLQDIFDSWPTVATVGAAAYILWAALSLQSTLQIEAIRGQANSCRIEVSKLQKTAKGLQMELKKAQKQQSPWGW